MERIVVEKNDSAQTIFLKILGVCEFLVKIKMQITNKECKRKLNECFDSLFEKAKKPNFNDIQSEVNFANSIVDKINKIMESYSLKEVILKSAHPKEYDDLVVVCKVIPNDKIGEYLENIPESRKFYAHKTGKVSARRGEPGEVIKTTLKTTVGGTEYILSEEINTVKLREEKDSNGEIMVDENGREILFPDVVVTNVDSTSNEEYVVKHKKFIDTYTPVTVSACHCGKSVKYIPVVDSRLLTQVDENVIIMTSWGAPAVCLAGSYIVTYNAEENDYNTIERGAFKSTYTKEDQPTKKLK